MPPKKMVKKVAKAVQQTNPISGGPTFQECLQKMVQSSPQHNAFRFENQHNLIWTNKELHQHSQAFALGLVELGYKPGDKLGFMVERSFPAEVAAAQMACAKTGVTMVPIKPASAKDLGEQLHASAVKGLLFSPNSKAASSSYASLVAEAVPESANLSRGSALKSASLPSLQHLIQTGFHSLPGTFKFRQMMLYGMRQSPQWQYLDQLNLSSDAPLFENLSGQQILSLQQQPISGVSLKESKIILSGENRSLVGLTAGLASVLNNQDEVVMTGNLGVQDVSKVAQWYPGAVLVMEDQVLLHSQAKKPFQEGLKQVVVHSHDQASQDALSKMDLQAVFGDVPVQKVLSSLQ